MLRHMLANMVCRLTVADAFAMAERDIANVFIKVMAGRVAVIVSFIGAHRMFVPLTGKHALPAYRLKSATDTANTGKEIDKPESIVRMVRWRRGQQGTQRRRLSFA